MTKPNTSTFIRKIALGLGVIAVSTMTLAGASQAKPKFSIYLDFGGSGFSGIQFGTGNFVNGWNYCDKYLWKYNKTGKFKYKKKYMKCMGYW